MAKDKDKEYAKLLYLQTPHSQKEISARVGITEKTLSKWMTDGDWRRLKVSLIGTKEQRLRIMYEMINAQQDKINSRPDNERYPNSKEADVLLKLTAAVKNMEEETSISQIVSVFVEFCKFLKDINYEGIDELLTLQDNFVKSQMK